MSEFFLQIVNMSISAGWIVLAVLLLRVVLKNAPRWITVLLWGIVAVRLVCPLSVESVISLMPSAETISPEIMTDNTPEINSGISIINNTINPIIGGLASPRPQISANPLQIMIKILSVVWIIGIVLLIAYTAISSWHLHRKVRTAVLLRDNIYQSEAVISPFVLGIIKPKIYLPFNMNTQNTEYVTLHEQAHIKRRDHLWKPLGFLLLTLHWFNPLMWLGYILLCRDIELACDEKVVKDLNVEERADYSQALLFCSVNRRMVAACPLAFGEVSVKERVKSVLSYKKPAFCIIIIAIIASIIVAVCFLTNPINSSDEIIEKLVNLDGYDVIEQDIQSITLSVPISALPESIYSQDGHQFSKDEIIVYKDDTAAVYLKSAQYSNEGTDNLYFCFDFTFDLPKKIGKTIYPFEILEDGLGSSVHVKNGILRADNGEFTDAVHYRGEGSDELIWFYVSTDALKQAQGTISFDININQISYWMDGEDYDSVSNVGGIDAINDNNYNLPKLYVRHGKSSTTAWLYSNFVWIW